MPEGNGAEYRVGLLGATEFNKAIKSMDDSLKLLNGELRAADAAYNTSDMTMKEMIDRQEKLQEVYDAQRKKVEFLREQLEKANEAGDVGAKRMQDLKEKLNSATAAMNKTGFQMEQNKANMQTLADTTAKLGDEMDTSGMSVKEAEKALKDMNEAAKDAGDSASSAGSAAEGVGSAAEDASGGVGSFTESLLDAAGAVGGGFLDGVQGLLGALGSIGSACVDALGEAFDLAKDAGKYADDLMTLSSQVGVDTDKLQQWQYSSNFIDTSVDTITGSLTKLTKKMASAQEEEKDNAQKWQEHLDKIAKGEKDTWSEATTARDAFTKLGVSWKDYNGNLRDNEEVFMDLIDALGKVENPVERDALAMDLFGKSAKELNPLIEAGSKAWKEMGQEAEAMGTVFSEDNLAIMGSFDDSMQRFNATGTALKNSIGLVMIPAFKPLVDAASSSMGKVAKALQDGVSPKELEGLLDEVINSAIDAFDDVIDLVEKNLPMLTQLATRIVTHLTEALPDLARVLLPGALGLLQGVLDGITQNIGPLTELATTLVTQVAGFLIDNLPEILDAGTELLLGLVDGIIAALPQLIPAALEMMVQLAVGLIEAIPQLVARLPEIIDAIKEGLKDTDWKKLGEDLLGAIWEGLGTIGDDLLGAFGTSLEDITGLKWDDIKDKVEEAIGGVGDFFTGLFSGALPDIEALDFSGISGAIEGAFSTFTGWFTGLFSTGKTDAENLSWSEIGDKVVDGVQGALGAGASFLSGAFTTAQGVIEAIPWDAVGNVIKTGVQGAIDVGGAFLSGGFEAGKAAIEALDWENLGKTIGDIGNGLVNLTGEVAAAGFEAAHGLIEGLDWEGLGKTVADVGNGLVNLTGGMLSGGFEAGYALIEGINWTGLGETVAAVPNGLIDLSGDLLAKGFQNGHDLIEKVDWNGLTDTLAAVPNGLISLSGEALSGAFSAAYDIISDIPWDELGNEVADGLGRAWGIVSGVGDVALGLGEGAVMAGQQGVGALKDWISSWRDDGEVETEATAVGAQVITDVGTGVTGEVPQLETTAQEAADALLEAIKGQLTETVVKQIGLDVDANIGKGIEEGKPGEDGLIVIVEALAKDAYKALSDAVTIQDFKTIGKAMDEGIAQGITNHSGLIETAAWNAAQAAYDSARLALDINSPSKKGGWLGEMFDLGFAGGLIDNADEIESAMAFLNDVTAAEAEPVVVGGVSAQGGSGFVLDYDRVRDAFVEAIEETGVGNMVMQMDKEIVGETLEPVTSRATRQRQQRSVKGRTARLVIG